MAAEMRRDACAAPRRRRGGGIDGDLVDRDPIGRDPVILPPALRGVYSRVGVNA